MKKRIGIQGTLVFLAILASLLFSGFLFPHWKNRFPDEVLDFIGIGAVLLGFLFRTAARGYKSEKSDNGKALLADGPYALMRHPMYFGTFLIGSGVVMVLFQWWVFLLFVFGFLLIYMPEAAKEEERLAGRFGDEYRRYAAQTPKYFPNRSGLFKTEARGYLSFKWPWVKKEIFPFIASLAIIFLAEAWEDARLFNRAAYVEELMGLFLFAILFISIMTILFYKREEY